MSDAAAQASEPLDPLTIMRQRSYRRLLLLAAIIGVVVSIASWAFLQLISYIQVWVFEDLPDALGYSPPPIWWPLPWLFLSGIIIAFTVNRLPGRGGHEPTEGLGTGGSPAEPIALPGIVLAALATIGLGLVLGPEAPLLALGAGLGAWAMRLVRRDSSDQAVAVMAAAGSFAAIGTIFGSPVIGAIIIIEAAGLGGKKLLLILLPGLIASGIGSLVFLGIGGLTGLSNEAFSIPPLSLPAYPHTDIKALLWSLGLAMVTAVVIFFFVELGHTARLFAARRPFLAVPVAGLVVGAIAIVFTEITGERSFLILFSGQEGMNEVVQQAATISLGTLALLIVFKGLAWSISLGVARGGPTFPAIFLGIVAGLLTAHLPGFESTPAIAVLIGAACVSVLRLPLSSIVLTLLVSQCGFAATPLVIVGVVAAYLVTIGLAAARERRAKTEQLESQATTGSAPNARPVDNPTYGDRGS